MVELAGRSLLSSIAPSFSQASPGASATMNSRMRRRVYVDHEVQGALVRHMVQSWLMSLVAIGTLTLLGWMFIHPGLQAFVGPTAFMTEVLPMGVVGLASALLVLPLVLWRLVTLSHRFVGPIIRLRRGMSEVADGGELRPINFRRGDYWTNVADDYNAMIDRFKEKPEPASPLKSTPEQPRLPTSTPLGLPASSLVQAWPVGHSVEVTT